MIKLFVTDLDGTLLDRGKRVSPEDKQALQEAERRGLQVCIASGRMAGEIDQVMDTIGGHYHTIAQNGASVRAAGGEAISAGAFERNVARRVFAAAEAHDLVTTICTHTHYYVARKDERTEALELRLFDPFQVVEDALDALGTTVAATKFSIYGERERLVRLQEQFDRELAGAVDSYFSDDDCLDAMPAGISKGAGLAALCERLGVSGEETVCIGDSFNDMPMFALTPHSFAMAAASPDVKRAAAREAYSVAEAVRWALRYNQQ